MRHRQQRGFTILELMITLAIVFVISAISTIGYRGYMQTARQQVIMAKVEQFRMFQDNYRIDSGTYLPGNYDAGVINDFEDDLGYVIADDTDGISFRVEAGVCGNIANCYRVIATDGIVTGTWENNDWAWVGD